MTDTDHVVVYILRIDLTHKTVTIKHVDYDRNWVNVNILYFMNMKLLSLNLTEFQNIITFSQLRNWTSYGG